MQVWQVAAGDGTRDYAEVFLRFGVILMGPGSEGNYFDNKQLYTDPESWVFRPFLQPLAESIQLGDLVILKRPHGASWEILAVGEITSDYMHCETFEDVDGWDLQHCRQVKWKKPATKTVIGGLRRGTLYGVNNNQALNEATQIWKNGEEIASLPIPQQRIEITTEELIDTIMVCGLSISSADMIAKTIWKLRRIACWYNAHGANVGEHEIRTFLIVPLLTGLGWPEQKIKIEWNNIDIAAFDSPYSGTSNPVFILESKKMWDGLLYAPGQAQQYAQKYPSCKIFIVSDGIRYKLFETDGVDWKYTAYMNLLFPKKHHPYLEEVGGAAEFFLKILHS